VFCNTVGLGSKACFFNPITSKYDTGCNVCLLQSCVVGTHEYNSGGNTTCEPNTKLCTSSEVGLVGDTSITPNIIITGDAEYISGLDRWALGFCKAENLPHNGSDLHGSGLTHCGYTSGTGKVNITAVFSKDCTYDLKKCDAGYYKKNTNPPPRVCEPVEKNYYSPADDLSRYACPNGGITAAGLNSSNTDCFKELLPYNGAHCSGKQTCFYDGSSGYVASCSVTSVDSCDAGYYYNGSDTNGTAVGKGYYSPAGDISRQKCAPGRYSASTTQGACDPCAGGFWCPEASVDSKGNTASDPTDKPCDAGYYCPSNASIGSVSAREKDCPVGSFCLLGSAAPTVCPAHHSCVSAKLPEAVCAQGYTLHVNGDYDTSAYTPGKTLGPRTCEFIVEPCLVGEHGHGWRSKLDGSCVLDPNDPSACDAGYHVSPDAAGCDADIVSCTTPYGRGEKQWNSGLSDYSNCVESACNVGYGLDNLGFCEPCEDVDPSLFSDAFSFNPRIDGVCEVASCKTGYHRDNITGGCVSNEQSCAIANGTGERKWSGSAWGICSVVECDTDYHIENNACVSDTRPCAISNGVGEQLWVDSADRGSKGHWSECAAKSCAPGYTSDRALTNDWSVPCGQCNNYYGYDGNPAVGSYSSECEIAVCMDQGEKYVLEGDECVPICEDRSDETGSISFNSSTRKCDTSCNTGAGYTKW
jgi:hypothetical protein